MVALVDGVFDDSRALDELAVVGASKKPDGIDRAGHRHSGGADHTHSLGENDRRKPARVGHALDLHLTAQRHLGDWRVGRHHTEQPGPGNVDVHPRRRILNEERVAARPGDGGPHQHRRVGGKLFPREGADLGQRHRRSRKRRSRPWEQAHEQHRPGKA